MYGGLVIKEDKGNPLMNEIYNVILIGINKDYKINKFNGEWDPTNHLQVLKYIMEFKYGINDILKANYFTMSLNGESRKWFHNSYAQFKGVFKIYIKCNIQRPLSLTNLMAYKKGSNKCLYRFVSSYQKVWRDLEGKLFDKIIVEVFIENIILGLNYIVYDHICMSD